MKMWKSFYRSGKHAVEFGLGEGTCFSPGLCQLELLAGTHHGGFLEATEVYPQAIKMMGEITPKYLAKESNLAMSQMKAALANAQDGDFTEAMQYYALIPNDSPLKADADKLVKESKAEANQKQIAKAEQERFNAELQAKIQMTANRCLLDKYKKDAAYDRLPWLRKVFYLGDYDPFDGYTPEEGC